jgi:hypothetical protein
MVVLNVCVVKVVLGKGTWGYGCTECVCFEYCYGEREPGFTFVLNLCCEYCCGEMELGFTIVLNVCVVNIVMGKGSWCLRFY